MCSFSSAAEATRPGASTTPVSAPRRRPRATPADTAPGSAASSGSASRQTPEAFDRRPNAELIGLKNLGIVVEDLSGQATACGLNHDTIESALSKRLTEGGFAVRRNSDEDTYVYVNVMSSSLSN